MENGEIAHVLYRKSKKKNLLLLKFNKGGAVDLSPDNVT